MLKTLFNNNKDKTMDELFEEVVNKVVSIGGKGTRKDFSYLQRYPEYHDNIKEFVSLYQYLENTSNPHKKILLGIEVFESDNSHAERRGWNILRKMLTRYLPNRKDDYGFSLNIKNVLKNGKYDPTAELEKIGGSFLEIDDLDLVMEKELETQREFADYLNKLSKEILLVIRGSKEQLDTIFSLMDTRPNFYFNYSNTYSYKELKDVIEYTLKEDGFIFEENWERFFKLYLSKPSEVNKKKGLNYSYYLREDLKKKALTDISQKKNATGKITIKNEYFGVNDNGDDFKNLKSLKKLNKLIGMSEAKENVQELIAYLEFNQKLQTKTGKAFPLNLHMMFTGSPGTGKTTLARIVAEILFELGYIKENKLVEVDKKDLVSQWVGHTSIKTNEIIQKARGGVLFIDEAYSVVDDRFGKDAIATLIKAMMDLQTELVVIVAGYEDEMLEFVNSNPGLRSRIGKHIHFSDYTSEELMEIYETKLTDYEIHTELETKEFLMNVVEKKRLEENFGNGRFIDNLIQDILFQHAVNTTGCLDDEIIFTIVEEDIPDKYKIEKALEVIS